MKNKSTRIRSLMTVIFLLLTLVLTNVSISQASEDDSESNCETGISYSLSKNSNLNKWKSPNSKTREGKKSKSDDTDDSDEECDSNEKESKKYEKKYLKFNTSPTILTCDVNTTLSWNAPNSKKWNLPIQYRIRYSTDNGLTWTIYSTNTNQTSISVGPLTSGLTYIFQISAQNKFGWGPWSSSSAGCFVPNDTKTYQFFIYGLDKFNPVILDYYSDGNTAVKTSLNSANDPESGFLFKSKYTYDIYISLPKEIAGVTRNFTLNGLTLAQTFLSGDSMSTSLGNHPNPTPDFIYSTSTTYAFQLVPNDSGIYSITIEPYTPTP